MIQATMERSHSPTISARRPTPSDVARCLVAEYLHDWGLRDPETISAESRRIVAAAMESLDARVLVATELYEAAITIAVEEVCAAQALFAGRTEGPAAGSSASIAAVPRMAQSLIHFPLPADAPEPIGSTVHAVQKSESRIVPQPRRCEMRPQPRAPLWKLLRRGYWRCVYRRLVSVSQDLREKLA